MTNKQFSDKYYQETVLKLLLLIARQKRGYTDEELAYLHGLEVMLFME